MRRGKIRVYTEALIGVPWVPQGPFYGLRGAAGRFHAEKLGAPPFRGASSRFHADKSPRPEPENFLSCQSK